MAVTWDPSNCSTKITLTNGNLTATANASQAANLCRATVSQSSGKYYMEITMGSQATSGNDGIGLCKSTTNILSTTAYLGHDGNPSTSMGTYGGTGSINGSFGNWSVVAPMAATNILGIAIDFTNKKAWWWRQSNNTWNGDVLANQNPSLNVGGLDLGTAHPLNGFGSGTAFFPALDLETSGDSLTANFGASAYSIASGPGVPTGFLNWDGTGGAATVVGWSKKLYRIPKHRLILPSRFLAKKIIPFNVYPPVPGAAVKPNKTLRVKRKPFLKTRFRPILPQLVRPPRPVPTRNKKVTYFKTRKLRPILFLPKHWNVIGQHATPIFPPITVGLRNPMRRVMRKHLSLRIKFKRLFPVSLVVKAHFVPVSWMYGSGPYGGGPYGSAGQLFVIGPPSPNPPFIGQQFWGYGGWPYGSGPYGAGGQYYNPPFPLAPFKGSIVAPAGPIRVADPYVSVVRSVQPTLAQTRKAAPGLQQVRTNPPKLNK